MFIGLLLKAMKSDVNVKRVAAFAKRVMQVIRNCTFSVIFFPTKRLTSLFISSMRSTSCPKTVFQTSGSPSAAAAICLRMPIFAL